MWINSYKYIVYQFNYLFFNLWIISVNSWSFEIPCFCIYVKFYTVMGCFFLPKKKHVFYNP